jgi:hypothetical protein
MRALVDARPIMPQGTNRERSIRYVRDVPRLLDWGEQTETERDDLERQTQAALAEAWTERVALRAELSALREAAQAVLAADAVIYTPEMEALAALVGGDTT